MVSIPRASEGVKCLIQDEEEGEEENESPGLSEAEEEVRGLR